MSKAIDYTKALVAIPSVSGNEAASLQYIHDWMGNAGLVDVVVTDDFVAGYKKGQRRDVALLLTGHIDTVAAGQLAAWQTNPWQSKRRGDKLYGLGVSDMKGGVAAAMAALEAAEQPAADTWLAVVANEEVDGSGTASFAQYFATHYRHYQSTSAIIPEPTRLAQIELGHRGNAFVRLTFAGQAGHGSQQASFGLSGMGLATQFLAAVEAISTRLVQDFTHPILGAPTIVPTAMTAGSPDSPNKTADEACVVVDIRTTPALDIVLAKWLNDLGQTYHFSWQLVASSVPASLCEPDAAIIATLRRAVGDVPTAISPGATDQGFLQAIGVSTVVFGPGEFATAHAQNEWASCQKIDEMTALLGRVIAAGP